MKLSERTLAVPLTQKQVDAAERLHTRMPQWRAANDALELVGKRFPGFDHSASLVKIVSLNGLYGTNLYAIHRMALHIVAVLKDTDLNRVGVELVEEIAALPITTTATTQRNHRSFASKFCHFFIDVERFPIMDAYAVQELRRHLGPQHLVRDDERPYWAFVQNLNTLRRLSGLEVTMTRLDHYLWIAGGYHNFERHPTAPLNADLKAVFDARPDDLRIMAGDSKAGQEGRLRRPKRR